MYKFVRIRKRKRTNRKFLLKVKLRYRIREEREKGKGNKRMREIVNPVQSPYVIYHRWKCHRKPHWTCSCEVLETGIPPGNPRTGFSSLYRILFRPDRSYVCSPSFLSLYVICNQKSRRGNLVIFCFASLLRLLEMP